VAAKREALVAHADLIRQAGLNPMVIDVDAFAVQNVMAHNYDFGPDEVVAMVNIGGEATNINIVRNGMPLYTQDVGVGGNSFVDALQKAYTISQAEAVAAVRGEEEPAFDLQVVVEQTAEELAMAIDRSIMFLRSANEADQLDRIYLVGGGVRVPGLHEFLSGRCEAEVEIGDPLRRVQFDPTLFGTGRPEDVAGSLAVGMGLAMRKVDER
jgi:type IV pilus assembly protein PilM